MPGFAGYGAGSAGGGTFGGAYGGGGRGGAMGAGNLPLIMELISRKFGAGQPGFGGGAPGGFPVPGGAMVPAGGGRMAASMGATGATPAMPAPAGAGGFLGLSPSPMAAGGGGAGDSDWRQLLAQLVEAGGRGGAFDPMGSSALMEMLRRTMIGDAGARQRSNQLGMQSSGVDPTQAGYLSLLGDIQGQSDLSRSLGGAQQASALQNQQFIQELLGNRLAQLYQAKQPRQRSSFGFGPVSFSL